MKCPIFTKWTILRKHLKEISPKILHEKGECAGTILFNDKDLNSSKVVFNSSGNTDSVYIKIARNHILSFHTHPVAAYINAGCVYGHPSGDDLSEFVRLSLKGVLNHAVFTLEGVYMIQIHPRFVEYVRLLSPELQKELCDDIYKYFRTYHGKRSVENVRKNGYTPREFVKRVNTFRITQTNEYVPEKIFSCVWYFSDNFLQYEGRVDLLWKKIREHSLPIDYTSKLEVTFRFLDLPIEDRTISNITRTLHDCVIKQ